MRGNQGTRGASPSRARARKVKVKAKEEETTHRDELGRGDREHLDRGGCAFPSRSDATVSLRGTKTRLARSPGPNFETEIDDK